MPGKREAPGACRGWGMWGMLGAHTCRTCVGLAGLPAAPTTAKGVQKRRLRSMGIPRGHRRRVGHAGSTRRTEHAGARGPAGRVRGACWEHRRELPGERGGGGGGSWVCQRAPEERVACWEHVARGACREGAQGVLGVQPRAGRRSQRRQVRRTASPPSKGPTSLWRCQREGCREAARRPLWAPPSAAPLPHASVKACGFASRGGGSEGAAGSL